MFDSVEDELMEMGNPIQGRWSGWWPAVLFSNDEPPVARTRNDDPLLGSGLVAEIDGTIRPVTEPCMHLTQWVP